MVNNEPLPLSPNTQIHNILPPHPEKADHDKDKTLLHHNLSAKDQSILATPDSQYHSLSWPQVQQIVSANRLDAFQRRPSDLRKYLHYCNGIKRDYGSIMRFIMDERLGWRDLVASGKPFEKEGDWKILWNDWPYGIDERIVHLVVWTKFELVDDEETGDLTNEARGEIEEWVRKVFGVRCGGENVIWFKNWKSLKSIHAVEHFHVMLFDPDPEFVKEITNGDIPMSRKV